MCVSIDPEIIFSTKMNFRPAISRPELVILNDREIDDSLLISHISGPLDEHIACHITHPRKAIIIVFSCTIRINDEGKTKQKPCDH
jgi:hypothetical protein